MNIIFIVIIALTFLALLDFGRAVLGPTAVDRIVAASAISTKGMGVIILLAIAGDNMSFLDVALVMALCGFVGLLALLRSLLPADADELTAEIDERPATLVRFLGEEGD